MYKYYNKNGASIVGINFLLEFTCNHLHQKPFKEVQGVFEISALIRT